METDMKERIKASPDFVDRSLAAFKAEGGANIDCARTAFEGVLDDGHFSVGDEVACTCGSIAGVIIAMNGEEAVISWACRGKSVEPVSRLTHVPHEY
jgi:hypothetical protein